MRATRAGLELTEAVSKLAASTPLTARVGIHTGIVVVGETGDGLYDAATCGARSAVFGLVLPDVPPAGSAGFQPAG